MSETELFPEENTFDSTAPPASTADVQHASAPLDTPTEPAAAPRGRRPSRIAASHTFRRRDSPSPSPSRRQPPSPTSSYASVLSSAPATEKWTVPKLRQALSNAGILAPHRMNKAELQALYASLQAGAPLPIDTPPSKAKDKTNRGRGAPYSRPDPTTTPPRTSFRLSGRSRRPSASLGRAPDPAANIS
ncbi:predicted GPI-anchored protein 58 [Sinocyclocheilus grahami]|uniref:predicted GPI-anchored protein 58 n=1 Tax=Sinocyclocheilus grahami TaxID=75366 RepID=UPI0007AD2302|nr:PREDICTED: predicted GPI-anchored protein 58 [Sinocyclocheilus grahami]